MLKSFFDRFALVLEDWNRRKDAWLFYFLRRWWPRTVTPNQLTLLRVAISLGLVVLLFDRDQISGLIILPLFALGALTDLLDGAIARCFGMETDFGRIADPIADRMLIVPVFTYAIIEHQALLFSLIFLEVLGAIMSLFIMGKNDFSPPDIFAKTKMVVQSVVLLGILFFWPQQPQGIFIGLLWFSVLFMIVSVTFKAKKMVFYYYYPTHAKTKP